MIPQSAELELAAAAPLTWLPLVCGNGRWRERRRRDVQKATSAMAGGAGVQQRRGKNEEECERRTRAIEKNGGVLPLVQGQYSIIPKYDTCRWA